MKKVILIILLSLVIVLTGCTAAEEPETGILPELNRDAAIDKVVAAQQAFFHISSGGNDFVYESFEYEGYPYRYMGGELDTWEKLYSYIDDIYTDEAIEALIEWMGLVEHEGRLAQPDADGGSIVDWRTAEVILAEDKKIEKTYDFTISYGESTETVSFTFVLDEGKWKLNYPLGY